MPFPRSTAAAIAALLLLAARSAVHAQEGSPGRASVAARAPIAERRHIDPDLLPADSQPAPSREEFELWPANFDVSLFSRQRPVAAVPPTRYAPNMIGDTMIAPSFFSSLAVDRLVARSFDLPGPQPAFIDDPYTVTATTQIEVVDFQTGALVRSVVDVGGFTTAISSAEMIDLINFDPGLGIPIIDHPAYLEAVGPAFAARNRAEGQIVFRDDASFAALQEFDPLLFAVFYIYDFTIPIAVPSPSGTLAGRMKPAENNSPLPRDRVYFDYSYSHNAAVLPGRLDVNRYTPGFEKAFLDDLFSVEMRFPIWSTLNNNLQLDQHGQYVGDIYSGEFGNMGLIFKSLIWDEGPLVMSWGLGFTMPTANDVRVRAADGTTLLVVDNNSTHIIPFLSLLYTPNERNFFQSFLQFDFDTNGNRVKADLGGGLEPIGRLQDQNLVYFDLAMGRWLFRNPGSRGLTAAAAALELHYNASLNRMDTIAVESVVIGDPAQSVNTVNLTVGGHFQFGHRAVATLGYSTPLTTHPAFDGQLRFSLNRYF